MSHVRTQPNHWRVTEGLSLALESDDLPPYTPRNIRRTAVVRREPTEHIYQLTEGKNRPWATLKVHSSAKSPQSLPTFFGKEPISAVLELQAEKGDSIHEITATVSVISVQVTGKVPCIYLMLLCFSR